MSPLSEVSTNLLRVSNGDVAAFERLTTLFVENVQSGLSAPAAEFIVPSPAGERAAAEPASPQKADHSG